MKNQTTIAVIGSFFLMTTASLFANPAVSFPSGSAREAMYSVKSVEEPFIVVEKPAEFPGGEEAFVNYINGNIQYPLIAKEQGIQGHVIVEVTIDETGKLKNIDVIQGIGGGCEEEVIRVISEMPVWQPTVQAGHNMETKKIFSFNFQL